MTYTWKDYPGMTEVGRSIGRKVEMVETDPATFGVLSTGEKLAVALVLDRADLLARMDYTILQAVERVGNDWLKSAIIVAKAMDD